MSDLALLKRVKQNLILTHNEDDALIKGYIAAAISYAEQYQHKPDNYYSLKGNKMSATTEQGVIMLSSHFYESRDGSAGGFFPDRAYVGAGQQAWVAVNALLRLGRDVSL